MFHDGNSAILAGPGSGKTATLVAKIWHLHQTERPGPRGIACLNYNNDCVREIRNRLRELGVMQRRGLFLGTVHSFGLNIVLRPYAALTLDRFEGGLKVAAPGVADTILEQTLSEIRPDQDARYYGPILTRFRRRLACREDVSGFDDDDPRINQDYVNRLLQAGLVDFELMVSLALHLIEEHAWVRELITARFPWMLVDEYQDRGGPWTEL
ncbi:MAG: ATP-dependent helicase [Chloroflexi bacterium]|nr:ATP-dependent helicase [Chloroflexota bacterium]